MECSLVLVSRCEMLITIKCNADRSDYSTRITHAFMCVVSVCDVSVSCDDNTVNVACFSLLVTWMPQLQSQSKRVR